MNTRKWIFLLVGAVLTGGALAVNWFDGSTVSSDATRLAGGNAQTAAHHADTAEPPVRRDPTPLSTLETGTKVPGEGLARDLADAQDYRQFSLRAVAKPELGGISYANYAQSVCRRYATLHAASGLTDRNSIPYDGKEDSTLYAKRVSYMQRMERRCASFSSNEISYDSALEFAAREVQEKDLHAVLKRRYERAANSGNEKERLQVASEVLATRDPLLLANLTYKFMGGERTAGSVSTLTARSIRLARRPAVLFRSRWISCLAGLDCLVTRRTLTSFKRVSVHPNALRIRRNC